MVVCLVQRAGGPAAAGGRADVSVAVSRRGVFLPGPASFRRSFAAPRLAESTGGDDARRAAGPGDSRAELAALPIAVDGAAERRGPRGTAAASSWRRDAEQGRMLFPQYGCTSCHSVAGSGRAQVGPDLARMDTPLFPGGAAAVHSASARRMSRCPAMRNEFRDEDLERVVAFVLVAQTFPRTQE